MQSTLTTGNFNAYMQTQAWATEDARDMFLHRLLRHGTASRRIQLSSMIEQQSAQHETSHAAVSVRRLSSQYTAPPKHTLKRPNSWMG